MNLTLDCNLKTRVMFSCVYWQITNDTGEKLSTGTFYVGHFNLLDDLWLFQYRFHILEMSDSPRWYKGLTSNSFDTASVIE